MHLKPTAHAPASNTLVLRTQLSTASEPTPRPLLTKQLPEAPLRPQSPVFCREQLNPEQPSDNDLCDSALEDVPGPYLRVHSLTTCSSLHESPAAK
jgi:hypothetical protein